LAGFVISVDFSDEPLESFKTTNCIENVNKQRGTLTDRVDRWQNSNQRQRRVGTALLNIEPRLNVLKGFKHLNDLRKVMQNDSNNKFEKQNKEIAA
jgi:hypothetical protein